MTLSPEIINPMKTKPQTKPAYGPFIATRQPLSRRHFLKGTGVALALPFLDTMLPSFAKAQSSADGALPLEGAGFVTVNDHDKANLVPIAPEERAVETG